MKKLWSFYWDCGCQGSVEGIFIATEEAVNKAIGCEVYFGEILGKHSDVDGVIEEGEIKEIKVSQTTVDELYEVLGSNISGYNPLAYIIHHEYCCRCEEGYDVGYMTFYVTEDDNCICDCCATEEERKTLKELEV